VCVSNSTTKAHVGTCGAVVWTLGSWVTIVWPAKWLLGEFGRLGKKCVLLLNSVPSFFTFDLLIIPNHLSEVSEVGVGGDEFLELSVFPLPCLTHDDDVVLAAEGVPEEGTRLQDDL